MATRAGHSVLCAVEMGSVREGRLQRGANTGSMEMMMEMMMMTMMMMEKNWGGEHLLLYLFHLFLHQLKCPQKFL